MPQVEPGRYLGWALVLGLVAIALGAAVFAGYERPRSELAFTFAMFAGIASLVLAIIAVRRALRRKRLDHGRQPNE